MAHYLDGPQQQLRAYSPAVVTEGGRIVWMAGQIATVDGDGKDISGNFEAQAHRVFALMDQTLQRVGGTLANLVTMTVFIKEPRVRRPLRRDPQGEVRRRSLPGQRAHHGHELRAARDRDRDPGHRRDRRRRRLKKAHLLRLAPSAARST